jgi:repressor LexA
MSNHVQGDNVQGDNSKGDGEVQQRPLTERQEAVLQFIRQHIQEQGFPPTLREIGRHFGIRSTKGVNDHLVALERKGRIKRYPELSRGIEIVGDNRRVPENVESLPLLGTIAAGTPLLASENVDQHMCIDRSLARGGEFMLCVQGDSMINAHICDGDYIVVRTQDTAEDGEIVAALIDDEATVKRFYRDGKRVRLQPENDSMRPIYADPDVNDIRILGKVVGVFRTVQ